MTLQEIRQKLPVLWQHWSSWCLWAITAIGSAQEFGVSLAEYIPRKVLVILAVCALATKIVNQKNVVK